MFFSFCNHLPVALFDRVLQMQLYAPPPLLLTAVLFSLETRKGGRRLQQDGPAENVDQEMTRESLYNLQPTLSLYCAKIDATTASSCNLHLRPVRLSLISRCLHYLTVFAFHVNEIVIVSYLLPAFLRTHSGKIISSFVFYGTSCVR